MRGALSSLLEVCCLIGRILYTAITVVLEVAIANQNKENGPLTAQSASGVCKGNPVEQDPRLAKVLDPSATCVAVISRKRRQAAADLTSCVPVVKRRRRPILWKFHLPSAEELGKSEKEEDIPLTQTVPCKPRFSRNWDMSDPGTPVPIVLRSRYGASGIRETGGNNTPDTAPPSFPVVDLWPPTVLSWNHLNKTRRNVPLQSELNMDRGVTPKTSTHSVFCKKSFFAVAAVGSPVSVKLRPRDGASWNSKRCGDGPPEPMAVPGPAVTLRQRTRELKLPARPVGLQRPGCFGRSPSIWCISTEISLDRTRTAPGFQKI
ncbi:unnamed protein product [Linum trigynum]|uniref:Uncharacterized protein n=1 Tax=Linum trigynum TaxID=586398 RepID=A0AAV2GG88_9ROSI